MSDRRVIRHGVTGQRINALLGAVLVNAIPVRILISACRHWIHHTQSIDPWVKTRSATPAAVFISFAVRYGSRSGRSIRDWEHAAVGGHDEIGSLGASGHVLLRGAELWARALSVWSPLATIRTGNRCFSRRRGNLAGLAVQPLDLFVYLQDIFRDIFFGRPLDGLQSGCICPSHRRTIAYASPIGSLCR
jgi:hypothetical protein